jgi:hypothetical protein
MILKFRSRGFTLGQQGQSVEFQTTDAVHSPTAVGLILSDPKEPRSEGACADAQFLGCLTDFFEGD